MTTKARSQWRPMESRAGKGTACPMWKAAAIPPETSGYSGAVTLKPDGNAQANCPCAIAQVLKTDSNSS